MSVYISSMTRRSKNDDVEKGSTEEEDARDKAYTDGSLAHIKSVADNIRAEQAARASKDSKDASESSRTSR